MQNRNNKKGFELEIVLLDKVSARIADKMLILNGPKGENKRDISNPLLDIQIKDNKIILATNKATKREKKMVYTYSAHIKNMIKGVIEGHSYVLKICSSHFPMNVSVNNGQLVIKNFLGEKCPRTLQLRKEVNVKIDADNINVNGVDKEIAGITASDIEKLTKRPGFDARIFQDGIYITNKDGKEIK